MPKEGYIRTTTYIRPDLYTRMRELNFNFSEWVNQCLDNMINGSNQELANLLNEQRALRARLAAIEQRLSAARVPPQPNREDQERALAERKERERRDQLAFKITEIDSSYFLKRKKPFEKFTTRELEKILKEKMVEK